MFMKEFRMLGINKMLEDFIITPLFSNLFKSFLPQLAMNMAQTAATSFLTDFFSEDVDLSAINNSTESAIGSLQKALDYLTKTGGGFDQKESIMKKTQVDQMKGVQTKYAGAIGEQVEVGKQLVASTGFAGSGIATSIADDMLQSTISDYSAASESTALQQFAKTQDFDIEKYQTLATLEKEMNSILGTYASATGETYSTQGLSGLSSEMSQLTGG